MNNTTYHEAMQRGTPDFPVEYYHIDASHPRYQMQAHWHREIELLRVLSGELRLFLNERKYVLYSGDSVLIPGGIIHGAQAIDCIYECIVFSAGLLYVSGQCRAIVKSYVQENVFYKNDNRINAAFNAVISKENGYQFAFLSNVYLLISEIAQTNKTGIRMIKYDKYEKIKSALALIEENYSSQLTLAELAESCKMSPNYFCRFFKQMTQKTPFDYINIHRINIACELLCSGNGNITDIAYSCGFNDLSYFIKIFRKYKGMSPKEYLKSVNP